MQTRAKALTIQLSEFESFCWPVKVRVRANPHPPAPRLSPTFPASVSFGSQPRTVVRSFELDPYRPTRRCSNWMDWSRGTAGVRRAKEAAILTALAKSFL
jgi:hypothetical protein